MFRVLNCEAFQTALNHVDQSEFAKAPATITGIKELIEHLEFKRLISVAIENSLWESDA